MALREEDQALAERCGEVRDALRQGVGWVSDNEDQVKQERRAEQEKRETQLKLADELEGSVK